MMNFIKEKIVQKGLRECSKEVEVFSSSQGSLTEKEILRQLSEKVRKQTMLIFEKRTLQLEGTASTKALKGKNSEKYHRGEGC